MARIFLCHASDDKAHVREVYHRLRAITSGAKMETLVPFVAPRVETEESVMAEIRGTYDSQFRAMALARAGNTLGKPELLQEAYATVQTILTQK